MIRTLAFLAAMLPVSAVAQQATLGSGAELRVLDKNTGAVEDVTLGNGQSQEFGYLRVTLNECRYPASNRSGDAFAAVTVWYRDGDAPVFEGWLVASSPALYAMDHPRYDVWVLRCTSS